MHIHTYTYMCVYVRVCMCVRFRQERTLLARSKNRVNKQHVLWVYNTHANARVLRWTQQDEMCNQIEYKADVEKYLQHKFRRREVQQSKGVYFCVVSVSWSSRGVEADECACSCFFLFRERGALAHDRGKNLMYGISIRMWLRVIFVLVAET
jgi:hypothetical protein